MKIGVLALQGAVSEHVRALRNAGAQEVVLVRMPEDLREAAGLIIPGGESTTIGKLMVRWGLADAIKECYRNGMAVFGTCAGMILMAREIEGCDQFSLGLVDMTVRRNAFGRQVESFEADIEVPAVGPQPVRGVFIRSPIATRVGGGVDVMGTVDGRIVLVRQDRCLASAFHPELTDDPRIHRLFLRIAAGEESA
ncbi:MAG: pyridoxal 5'-phosphate synthase glutaminase subunit PdxT [Armatimonadota bacterium]